MLEPFIKTHESQLFMVVDVLQQITGYNHPSLERIEMSSFCPPWKWLWNFHPSNKRVMESLYQCKPRVVYLVLISNMKKKIVLWGGDLMPINLVGVNFPPINILRRGRKIAQPRKERYLSIQGIFQLEI